MRFRRTGSRGSCAVRSRCVVDTGEIGLLRLELELAIVAWWDVS